MDSLIGKKVWTSFGSLRLAVVTAEHKDPEYWEVKYGDGDRGTTTRGMMHLTNEEAKAACEENADYWQRQVSAMNELIYGGKVGVWGFRDGEEYPK